VSSRQHSPKEGQKPALGKIMRTVWIVLGLIVVLLVWRGYEFVSTSGMLRELEPQMAGTCTIVPGVVGPEDHTIDPATGVVYLSGYDRVAAIQGNPTPGAIWAYDLMNPAAVPVNLTPDADAGFQPHGISLYTGEDGAQRLFVINHGNGEQAVDIFTLADGSLQKVKTVTGDLLRSPNDVVAVSPEAFYFSNDHRFLADEAMRPLEDFLGLPMTDAVYFDGTEFRSVAPNLTGANGINVSEDGKTLYVAAARGSALHVYDRDLETGDLTHQKVIALPGLPDNIELLPDGKLLVALHAKVFDLLAHFGDASHKAPSQIVKIDPVSGDVETVFLSLGEDLSAASTGAQFGDRLIIGAIIESKFLDCNLSASN
jgi:arylesterase / paraoxonase